MLLPDERLWRRLSPLLDRALELSRPERADLVAGLRESDPEFAAALEDALAAHEGALAAGFLAREPAPAPASLRGQVLGAYTLVDGSAPAAWAASGGRGAATVASRGSCARARPR
jgi:hypothetical protein